MNYPDTIISGPSQLLRMMSDPEDTLYPGDGVWVVGINEDRKIELIKHPTALTEDDASLQVVFISLNIKDKVNDDKLRDTEFLFQYAEEVVTENNGWVLDKLVVIEPNKFYSLMCTDEECCPREGKPYNVPTTEVTIDPVMDIINKLLSQVEDK